MATSKVGHVSQETVLKASKSLLQWRNSNQQSQKPQLLDQEDFLYLVVTLRKIPPKGRTNPYKIPLPHSLHTESSELCLIIDDRSKSGLTKDAAKKKIKSENIPISKIVGLSKLKTDYRPFEGKRKLCDSYDLFFADDRIIPLLPSLLGKHFFKKKKIPVPLNLRHKNWKEQIEKNCTSALLYLRTGTCCVVKVAKASMEVEEIVSNVLAAVDGIAEIVPKKWGNVRSFHLKLLESIALPIYQSVPDMKLKIEVLKGNDDQMIDSAGKNHVKDSDKEENENKVNKNRKKGRIHEVRYMDNNMDELFDEDEMGSDEDEVGSDEDEDVTMGGAELKGKKRNRFEKVKVNEELGSELNVEKRTKKSTSVKNKGSIKQKEDDIVLKNKKEHYIKQKKDSLSVEDGEALGKKEKKSGFGKLKAAGTKVKTKKLKAEKS